MLRRTLRFTIGTVLLMACHHGARELADPATPCFTSYPPPPAGTIRIDGPGAFGPHPGDSLIVRSDNRARWRGVLLSCQGGTIGGLQIDFGPWQAIGDTLEIIDFHEDQREHGPRTWSLQLAARRKSKG